MQISFRFDQHARDVYVSHTNSIATCSEIPDIVCLMEALTLLVVAFGVSLDLINCGSARAVQIIMYIKTTKKDTGNFGRSGTESSACPGDAEEC